ncbi:membrane associated rhomboid family serine protease [Rhizomicrobium palustre]|uniref:Membrane associated rhomboid family serine protease n=1 Tax=Rhizomicrobium palustre TaxID=189966 RepID=A0A846N0D6_9PROT|nr:rhomboid family intramembrane serine protease [Rhizomicrobium palustre]NIK88650.1 membrane associated rhomboid family serine protease [Rhizomicrobium palustre]
MIPISDDNPTRITPLVTWALILACVGVYLWQLQLQGDAFGDSLVQYGFIPSHLMSPQFEASPSAMATIFTAMFLHGGFLHLAGNMLYLWIFGNNIEEAMGHVRFLLFYLLAGLAAALTMAFMDPLSIRPMVGASGAISGVLGAYMLLYPRAKVTVLVPLLIILYPFRVNAMWVVGVWFAMQLLALTGPDTSGIAWWAHLGGFGAGIALTPFLKSSGVPFFGPRTPRGPWSR